MDTDLVGKVIRRHSAETYEDIGRIVHVARAARCVYFVPLPKIRPINSNSARGNQARKAKSTAKNFYVKAPQTWALDAAQLVDPNREFSLVDFNTPKHWRYTDDELLHNRSVSDSGNKHRRDMKQWLEKRNILQDWIAPIVGSLTLYELLELGRLNDEVQARARQLGHKDSKKVARAMRLHLLGCGHPNALLPAWGECGSAGSMKFCASKCGRPSRQAAAGGMSARGFVLTATARDQLIAGWKKYRSGKTAYKAFLLTSAEYWPGDKTISGRDGCSYLLAPAHKRPTFAQFRRAAEKEDLNTARSRMTEREYRLTARPLSGKASDGVIAVGQVGWIDSTSEDQTPVSSMSRVKVLPSSLRTILLDVRSTYLLGVHSGYEHPSTMTALLAILNGCSSKVAFCARYGVTITEDLWHSRMPKRIRGDNGELKSERGITTLNQSECAVEFVRSYGADLKGPVEAGHHTLHRRADHLAAGSTKGRHRQRGETRREDAACRTHFENMPFLIRSILFYNNEEPVPELLTMDMRRDGVAPTRKAIYEWLVRQGYEASEPTDLQMLRTRCLPRISARILRDGVHLVDPCDTHRPQRLIPQLRYTSASLVRSGLCEKAGKGVRVCEVGIDPNVPDRCFLDHRGTLLELELRSGDPRSTQLTLYEHLRMTLEDSHLVDAMTGRVEEAEAQILVENERVNRRARLAKQAESRATGHPLKRTKHQKRENHRQELELERLRKLGIDPNQPPAAASRLDCSPEPQQAPSTGSLASSRLLAHLRSRVER